MMTLSKVLLHGGPNNGTANDTTLVQTRPAYAVTDLRRDPVYINLYVNWFRLVASGVVPMARYVTRILRKSELDFLD